MLKQGRAFGVGLLLATQNPVDLDYKALSNAGTWFIGRLQTDQDKQRLLDGLQSAGGEMDMAEYNRLISSLQKRVFLMHSVNKPAPQLFQSRWTLNFLAGPLTRAQIPDLNRLGRESGQQSAVSGQPAGINNQPTVPVAMPLPTQAPASAPTFPVASPGKPSSVVGSPLSYSTTRQAPPAGLAEYFIPADLGLSQAAEAMNISLSVSLEAEGIVYQPALLAQAQIRYLAPRYAFEYQRQVTTLMNDLRSSLVVWEDYAWRNYRPVDLQSQPLPQARFAAYASWLADARRISAMQKDFPDWVYRTGTIRLRANQSLKVFAGPQTTTADFRDLCSQQAHANYQAEAAKINASYDQKITALRQKITREEAEVDKHKDEVNLRKKEELGAGGEFLLGLLSRRKRSLTTSLTKRRLAEQAKDDLAQVQQELATLEDQLQALELVRQNMLEESQDRWAKFVNDTSEVPLVPQKKDIFVELFGVAWLPHYLVRVGEEMQEIEAFSK